MLEVPPVAEALATTVTYEFFVARVDLLVGLQAVALVESVTAHIADIWLFARVDTVVAGQVAHVAEALVACVAGERLFARVQSLESTRKKSSILPGKNSPLVKYHVVPKLFSTQGLL